MMNYLLGHSDPRVLILKTLVFFLVSGMTRALFLKQNPAYKFETAPSPAQQIIEEKYWPQ